MSFRLAPTSVTLNDLERLNGRYIALFHWIWYTCVAAICGGIYARVYCIFSAYVQCRRKESSRSLSYLLMSFLLLFCIVLKRSTAQPYYEEHIRTRVDLWGQWGQASNKGHQPPDSHMQPPLLGANIRYIHIGLNKATWPLIRKKHRQTSRTDQNIQQRKSENNITTGVYNVLDENEALI